jgi:4-hydroxy 2-oxovalerate aldolase
MIGYLNLGTLLISTGGEKENRRGVDMTKKVTILDCTLRDGGYYNEWDFTPELAKELITSLTKSGVDIVELGYRSPSGDSYGGLFKYCIESLIRPIVGSSDIEFAFMIDAKDFITNNVVDIELLNKNIPLRDGSIFTWVRVATYANTMPMALEIAGHLSAMGYRIGLNLMTISLIPQEQLPGIVKTVEGSSVEVFYFADSFGTFLSSDIERIYKTFKDNFSGKIGFHGHDNLGLAFANSLKAIECGVDFIDGTVAGMGRGVGNLKTEQMVMFLYYHFNQTHLDPFALSDLSATGLRGLLEKYQWGWDLSYMLAGLQNVHPTYCQRLRTTNQYTLAQVTAIISAIPAENCSKFNNNILLEAINKVVEPNATAGADLKPIRPVQFNEEFREIILVARGLEAEEHGAAIRQFIKERNPLVIECNDTGLLKDIRRQVAVLNPVRLSELLNSAMDKSIDQVVVGFPCVDSNLPQDQLRAFPCHLKPDAFSINEDSAIIPNYLVGSLALAYGLALKPSVIYLAGFDGSINVGYTETENMESLFRLAQPLANQHSCTIKSITKTTYPVALSSIYALLDKK